MLYYRIPISECDVLNCSPYEEPVAFSVSVDVSAASFMAVCGSVVGAAVVVFTIVAVVSAVSV